MGGETSEAAWLWFLVSSVTLKSEYGPFIGGKQITGRGEKIPVINPATGEIISTVTSASPDDVSLAISLSQEAFNSGLWSRSSPKHRATVLTNFARLLEARVPELAQLETLQTGRTLREMKAQLGRLPEWLDYFASIVRTHQGFVAPTQGPMLNYITRVPLGVVGQITPFNHPLLIAVKKIAPALAAGNSVIVKPSELAPISVIQLAEIAAEAGVPPSVLTIIPGGVETAQELVSHPTLRKVDVTAGTKAGRAIGSKAGANLASYTAELGGKAPVLVFNDADLQCAINGVAFASFVASGQTCVSGTRIIVQEGIYDTFMSSFLEKVKNITSRIGDPLNPLSTMGPVISTRHLERVSSMVSQTRGNVLVGGSRMGGLSSLDGYDLSKGSFFPPTIVTDIDTEDELWKEEVFGPVVVVKKFRDDADGVRLANDCKYGLGAGLWTTDLSRAHRLAAQIEAGLVWVNTHHRNDPSSPWGGMKESGIGRENGIEAFESYTQSRSTIINIANSEDSKSMDDWFAETSEDKRYG